MRRGELSRNSTQTARRSKEKRILSKKDEIKWLFFDVGSTLIDESKVYEYRMKKIAELSGTAYEQVYEYAMSFYKKNKKGDLEAARGLGVELPKWESQYERLYKDTRDCLKRLSGIYKIGVIANQSLGTCGRLENFGIKNILIWSSPLRKKVFQNQTGAYLKLHWKEAAASWRMLSWLVTVLIMILCLQNSWV